MTEDIKQYRKSIINRSFWTAAGLAILASFLHYRDYALGIVLGVLVSSLNFLMLSIQVGKLANTRRNFFVGSFLARYGLLAVCLFLILKYPQVNIFGFLIGYFILQLNLVIAAFLNKSKPSIVIASEAKQSQQGDCFVANAPRNDIKANS